jgi:hypothetical protein
VKSYNYFSLRVRYVTQKLILVISFWIFRVIIFKKKSDDNVTVVGVHEIASMLHNISEALPNSVSINLVGGSPYYDFSYSYDFSKMQYFRLLWSPVLLGYLATRYNTFLYIGDKGFLINKFDGREYEYSFLRKNNKKIICYFVGSEIRSFKLLNRYALQNNIDVITTYQGLVSKGIDSEREEKGRKKLAEVADKYANKILNPSIDQMSYIKCKTYPILYFYPDNEIKTNLMKWNNIQKLVIIHASTSPIIKGTQLVRAAIKKLQMEGYKFKYVEIIGGKQIEILKVLKDAHIVLNEFYAFVPGMFGIEAMANNCVLLTSADSMIEHSLPLNANNAWVVTKYWQIYDNLKEVLDCPEELKGQADYGTAWTMENYSFTAARAVLQKIISD